MLSEVLTFQFGAFYGGGVGNLLSYLEQVGAFSYVLPFLLIFALVFGILNQIRLFENNRAINAIIALVVGLLALQFDFVPVFFSEIFPRLGVGLAVLLILLILVGMFVDPKLGWQSGFFWQSYGGAIIGVLILLVIFGVIIAASSPRRAQPYPPYHGFWPFGGAPPTPARS
jgi:hypothetical protein